MKAGAKRINVLLLVLLCVMTWGVADIVTGQNLSTKAQWNSGNLAYYDGNYSPSSSMWTTCPLLAILNNPSIGTVFEDDFYTFNISRTVGALDSFQGAWIYTSIDQGSGDDAITLIDATGGVSRITMPAGDNDGVECQWDAANFNMASGKPVWFEGRVKISENKESDLHLGFAATDTDIIGGVANAAYIYKADGDSALSLITVYSSTADTLDLATDVSNNTWVKLGLVWDGATYLKAYVNGVYKGQVAIDIPTVSMCLSFGLKNGTTTADTLYIDYLKSVQIR